MAIAPIIALCPSSPDAFKTTEEIKRVAIAIPETGLLLLPTRPTSLEDTVAKKKPKTAIIKAPIIFTGIDGRSHISSIIAAAISAITFIGKSFCVLSSFSNPFSVFLKSFMACIKVFQIKGADFTRLIIPPAATAPAPI